MQTTFVSNSPSTQIETVTTPIDMEMSLLDGLLDPVFTRPTHQGSVDQQEDLDTQPMRGPKEPDNTTDLLDNFIDENYGDVLRTSILNPSSYLPLPSVSVKTSPQQPQPRIMAMDWYVPDGTNHRIIEVPEKTIADFRSPGGGTGALVLTLSRMVLHYNTVRYLVDIDTGELFRWIANQWYRTGLYCSTQPFVIKELIAMTNRCSAALQMDLEQEQQTSVIQLSSKGNTVSLPPLPAMPDPEAYVLQPDVMNPRMRRNYTLDRTNAALTYITEYEQAQQWQQDTKYDKQQVLQRLQIIYGKADKARKNIDAALHNDDIFRRRRVMRSVTISTRFPQPQNMKDSSISTWVTWIRDESNGIIAEIDEEIARRQDPDDPFDGTASGIFAPLPTDDPDLPNIPANGVTPDGVIDKSKSRNALRNEPQEAHLVEVPEFNGIQREGDPQQGHTATTLPPQQPNTSTNRTVKRKPVQDVGKSNGGTTQGNGNLAQLDPGSTDQRIEESTIQQDAQPNLNEPVQQIEDPFQTLRSFYEKQRMGRQQNNSRPSVSSYSMLEGAVGGVDTHSTGHPQPKTTTKKNQQDSKQQKAMQPQEFGNVPNNRVHQDDYFQGSHNTTTYMNLPSGVQNKICGRCDLVGHLKRHCKEEVYCKYCRTITHATTVCRTYPVMSSRENTPEKKNTDKIEREVNRRVQEEMRNILDNLQLQNRAPNHVQKQVDTGLPHQHIPVQGQPAEDLIGDFDQPNEVYDNLQMRTQTNGEDKMRIQS